MIKIITNSNGSGDWVVVQSGGRDGFETLHEGHQIGPSDLVDLLRLAGVRAELVEVTDAEMEEGNF